MLLCIIWQCWMECSDMLCPFLLQILWEFGKRNSSVERCHLLTFLEMLPSCLLSSRYCYHHNFLQPKLCLLCIAMRYFGFRNVFQNRSKPSKPPWSSMRKTKMPAYSITQRDTIFTLSETPVARLRSECCETVNNG